MNTAELIVRVLDCAADHTSPEWDNPEVARFASLAKDKYRAYRLQMDFMSASRRAKIETVEEILK